MNWTWLEYTAPWYEEDDDATRHVDELKCDWCETVIGYYITEDDYCRPKGGFVEYVMFETGYEELPRRFLDPVPLVARLCEDCFCEMSVAEKELT